MLALLAPLAGLIVLGFAPSAFPIAQTDDETLLVTLNPVKADLSGRQDKVSIGGLIFDTFLQGQYNNPSSNSYDLGRRYRSFTCYVGVSDAENPSQDRTMRYRFLLDGDTVKSGTVERGKPTKVELDVTGKRGFRIDLDGCVCIAAPTLSKKPVTGQPPGPNGAKSPAIRPNLSMPTPDAHVHGDSVVLGWSPVEGAACYAVQIVLIDSKESPKNPDTRMWTIMAGNSATTTEWDMKGLPKGTYNWTVLAFGETKTIGVFSADRNFIRD